MAEPADSMRNASEEPDPAWWASVVSMATPAAGVIPDGVGEGVYLPDLEEMLEGSRNGLAAELALRERILRHILSQGD